MEPRRALFSVCVFLDTEEENIKVYILLLFICFNSFLKCTPPITKEKVRSKAYFYEFIGTAAVVVRPPNSPGFQQEAP